MCRLTESGRCCTDTHSIGVVDVKIEHMIRRGVIVMVALCAACGDDDSNNQIPTDGNQNPTDASSDAMRDSGTLVSATARVIHGPRGSSTSSLVVAPAPPADGRWAITPDQARITLVSVTFTEASGQPQSASLTNCKPTYSRTDPALTKLLDCPFEIPPGTYTSIGIGASTTYEMLLNDPLNGFFTTSGATKVVTSPPIGGSQFASFTVSGPGGMGNVLTYALYLKQPLVVTPGSTIALDILVDMIHMVGIDVSGGGATATVDVGPPTLPAELVPSVSGAGRTEFYSVASSSANRRVGPLGTTSTWGGVRAFYAEPPQPSYIFHPVPGPSQAYNVNPANAPPNGTSFKAGGYLGVDSQMRMCWAMPTDYTYASYNRICRMQLATALNASTTLECQTMSTAPAPTSGDTYASGCPALTPNVTVPLTLIAN